MRSRTAAVARALWITLFLGGFLALAFVLSGQAHADTLDGRSVRTLSDGGATTVVSVDRNAGPGLDTSAARAGKSVRDTVTATAGDRGLARVTGLICTLRGTVGQATAPVTTVIGTVGVGHGGSGHGGSGGSGGGGVVRPVTGPVKAVAVRSSVVPAPRGGAVRPIRRDARHEVNVGRVTHPRAPGHTPAPAQRSDHPVEGDGGAHHSGGAYAVSFGAGTRIHLSAVGIPAAHGSAPLRRVSDVSVQPD